eukprot:m51a1_g13947 hypothetical protein (244) ;mRNA; r:903802-904533
MSQHGSESSEDHDSSEGSEGGDEGDSERGWERIREAVAALVAACRPGSGAAFRLPEEPHEWLAFFSFGTVVRIRDASVPAAPAGVEWDYDPQGAHREGYPDHRIESEEDLERTLRDNRSAYDAAKAQAGAGREALVKLAYRGLVDAGYPFPGCELGDSLVHCVSVAGGTDNRQAVSAVVFPALERDEVGAEQRGFPVSVFSLALDDSPGRAHMFGRETRRYDYMVPRLVALVHTANLDHIYFL